MMLPPYIGFEGPIGAGKTTLARLLSDYLRADLLLEEFDANEFLPDFYEKRERWALPMQLWFLSSRHEQLSAVPKERRNGLVADYTHFKDAVFAGMLLKDREWRLYDRLSRSLRQKTAEPNLLVYVDARDEVLLERIRRRGRDYEARIDTGYLAQLRDAYETNLLSTSAVPVVSVDTSSLDLRSEAQLFALFQQIIGGLPEQSRVTMHRR